MLEFLAMAVIYILGFYVGYTAKRAFGESTEILPITKESRTYMQELMDGRRVTTILDLKELADRFDVDEKEIKKAYKIRQSVNQDQL